ncbi:MAG TPA: DUF3611 family protein [Candidatus Caenarcaniphilales bacterium]
MANKSGSLPPLIKQIVVAFRRGGWIGFWVQLVLAAISSLSLLFAVFSSRNVNRNVSNPGTGFGLLFAACGLILLCVSVYWAYRYTRLSNRLEAPNRSLHPKKKEMVKALRIGLTINMVGILLTLLGAEATIGLLLAKSLSQGQTLVFNDPNRLIQPLDILVVQSNTNIIAAHFVGLVTSFWLFNRLDQP